MRIAEPSIERILSEVGVRFAYLCGSRAAGFARPDSDADIAISLPDPPGLVQREHLAAALAEVLDVPDVDLIVLEEASLELRGRVVQEGRILYSADEVARVAFEVRTRSEYFDFEPTLREMTSAYLRRVARQGL